MKKLGITFQVITEIVLVLFLLPIVSPETFNLNINLGNLIISLDLGKLLPANEQLRTVFGVSFVLLFFIIVFFSCFMINKNTN